MNIIDILVRPVAPYGVIILLGILLAIYLLWKELSRNSSARFSRILATTVIIAAIGGLAFRPSVRSEIIEAPAILLTKGYDPQKADSLKRKYPDFQIIRTSNSSDYQGAKAISDEELREYVGAIKIISGEGLPLAAFDRNPDLNFSFSQGKIPEGITTLQTETYVISHRGTINGKFNNSGSATRLQLKGPGGIEDSILIKTKGEFNFSVHFTPRQSGKFSYEIISTDDSGKVRMEKIPLEILPERKLNILFLQQFPSTEIRYLKNFLADRGHGVVLRYQVSKNLYRYEFGNHATQPMRLLSEALLSDFDLLIVTASDLKGLDEGDRKTIENAVRSGLGAIVVMDDLPDPKLLAPLLSLSFKKNESDTVHWEGLSGRHTLFSLPAFITANRPAQMITVSKERHLLSGYQYLEMGKVGFQSLRETYTMILKGIPEAYSEIWTPLIEQTAKNVSPSFKIIVEDPYPMFINDPISVQVISSGARPALQMDGISVPLIEDVVVNDFWHGKIWVGKSGWHQLMVSADSTIQNFYVEQRDSTSSLALANQIKNNLAHHKANVDLNATESKMVVIEISSWIYFALFLLAGTYLWLEPRI